MVKCEICSKLYSKKDINQHIQLELQDPKYMDIKRELQDK